MRFLHYATEDCRGGAARAGYYIHRLLLERGHESRMVVRDRYTYEDETVLQVAPSPWRYRVQRFWRMVWRNKRGKTRAQFNYDEPTLFGMRTLCKVPRGEVDVVCIHWITGLLTVRDIRRIHRHYGRPMVWLMNDQQPITGGCHYSLGCDGYSRQCGECPVIGSKSENDRSRTVWRRKKELLSPLPLVLWTASSGSAAKASRSSLFGGHRRIEVPGPVDDTMFRPLPMAVAREALRLPQDKKVILLAATLLDEERKGMRHAVEALNVLRAIAEPGGDVRPDNVHLVLVGRGARTLALSLAFAHTNVGFLSDQIALALAYQSADVFLCPSTDDEGPMMVTESMLCGTPVVMFRVGISGDLIRDGETGYSAPVGDAAGLARGLLAVLTDQVPCNMRAAARDAAVEAQSPGRVMPRLEASFRDLVAEMGPKA